MFKIIWTELHQEELHPPYWSHLPVLVPLCRDSLLSSSCMSETLSFWISQSFEGVFHGSKSKIASASELRAIPRTPQLYNNVFCLKYMCVCVLSGKSDSANPHGQPPHSQIHGILVCKNTGVVVMLFSIVSSDQGLSLASPALTGGFWPLCNLGGA